MSAPEKDVRAAARRLHDAVMAARRAGLTVAWPARIEDLPAIAISETGRARPAKTDLKPSGSTSP